MELAIFDFCETLANFQTADAFVEFAEKKYYKQHIPVRIIVNRFICRCRLLNIIDKTLGSSYNKRLVLRRLRGVDTNTIDEIASEYYKSIIKPNLINETIRELEHYRDNGTRVIIVSGGYDVYLRYFVEDYNIPSKDLFATKLEFKNNRLTGNFVGRDCLRLEKVRILESSFKGYKSSSIAFSDSSSDEPMLTWASEQVLVIRSDRKPWRNFKNIIVWKKK